MSQAVTDTVVFPSPATGIDYLEGAIARTHLAGSRGLGPWADDDDSSSSGPGGTGSDPGCQENPTSAC